ncbi:MAG: hypothetical protein CL578_23775 [Alteromonadaceae bacterium]|uniref:hypothetical protein n=1 Tax=Paraglaciecola chathamensis TaxID=368405 RepID=UPI000C4C6500|nr:hypothetical protein [Paraglaciecola agarilytica]MBN28039.1 hypothetical protein [Alteromonadaceae bacterium]|tara:strand:+ start:59754 stop:60614 length:861 start_codon:yes stop_codon:yes gene_type:complete
MDTRLIELKNSIISLGIERTDLQKIMDDIYTERSAGELCLQCSETTTVQTFIEDGFKIHRCSKCPYCILEFSFQITSKKQKGYDSFEGGLHLRGKRAGKIDEYLYFSCRLFDTVELRSKDIAIIKIPFCHSSIDSEKSSKNNALILSLAQSFEKIISEVEQCNLLFKGYAHYSPLEIYDYELRNTNLYLDYCLTSDDESVQALVPARNKVALLEDMMKNFDDKMEQLEDFERELVYFSIDNPKKIPRFLFNKLVILNESINVEYKLNIHELHHSKILGDCISKLVI